MGFPQETAREALIHSNNNFDVATEYLLNRSSMPAAASASSGSTSRTNDGSRAVESVEVPSTAADVATAIAPLASTVAEV